MTDDLYIRMILALPEDFFKDWQLQEGDMFLVDYGADEPDVYYIGDCCLNYGKIYDTTVDELDEIEGELPLS